MIDWEILRSPGFVILGGGAWVATILGWLWSRKSDMASFSIVTLIIVLLVEIGAAYYFASRD